MALFMRENFPIILKMVWENFNIMMEAIMKVHTKMIKEMEKANLSGQIMNHMKECGQMIISKAKEN